jgi:hypothetical protein
MAAIQYVLLGSVRRVAEATGIPIRTLYDWQKTDWWETLVAQVRTEMEGELDQSYQLSATRVAVSRASSGM